MYINSVSFIAGRWILRNVLDGFYSLNEVQMTRSGLAFDLRQAFDWTLGLSVILVSIYLFALVY